MNKKELVKVETEIRRLEKSIKNANKVAKGLNTSVTKEVRKNVTRTKTYGCGCGCNKLI
jgi:hypothetical protein